MKVTISSWEKGLRAEVTQSGPTTCWLDLFEGNGAASLQIFGGDSNYPKGLSFDQLQRIAAIINEEPVHEVCEKLDFDKELDSLLDDEIPF